MRPEIKSDFFRAASALGLDEGTRDKAWRRMTDLGMSPDEPTVIFLAVAGLLEAAASKIPDAVNALPGSVEEAARKAVGPIANAAAKKVRLDMTALAEQLGREVGTTVAVKAEDHFRLYGNALQWRVSGTLTAAALVMALLFMTLGFACGRVDVVSVAAEWQTVATRSDARSWLRLAAINPDIDSTIHLACAPGSKNVFPVQGALACNMPLWLEAPAASAPGSPAAYYMSFLEWLAGYRPIVVLLFGLLGGLLMRRMAKLIVSGGPLRWMLDL